MTLARELLLLKDGPLSAKPLATTLVVEVDLVIWLVVRCDLGWGFLFLFFVLLRNG